MSPQIYATGEKKPVKYSWVVSLFFVFLRENSAWSSFDDLESPVRNARKNSYNLFKWCHENEEEVTW